MNTYYNTLPSYIPPLFKTDHLSDLTLQEKKILIIASGALCLLATLYLANKHGSQLELSKKKCIASKEPHILQDSMPPGDGNTHPANQVNLAATTKASRNDERLKNLFQSCNHPNQIPANQTSSTAKMINIRQKTEFVDDKGNLLSNADIIKRIVAKIQGIYSVDSVTVNKIQFTFGGHVESKPARKIEIKRTMCLYDLVPLGVFLPTLFNRNSVYHKVIYPHSIQDFLLGAKPKKHEIEVITAKVKASQSFQDISSNDFKQMNQLIGDKYDKEESYEVSEADKVDKTPQFIEKFQGFIQAFKNEYETITLEGRNHLLTAYWKSKSLTIYIPEEIDSNNLEACIEIPRDVGVTPSAIAFALSCRSLVGL